MTLDFEQQKFTEGFTHIIGCDEVGRGCLAGPVVAVAVVVPKIRNANIKTRKLEEVRDSKLLSPTKRVELAEIIKQNFSWGIGVVEHRVIDEINIHRATLLAMKKALENLLLNFLEAGVKSGNKKVSCESSQKFFLAVDGKFPITGITLEQEAVVGGDSKIFSIAAASIVAKVYRDRIMETLDSKYPVYGFKRHKGYATFHHRQAIELHGLSDIHRVSFCGKIGK